MSVRIAGRSYELLSASTSLSDDDDDVPVDASLTSAPPAYEDEGDEGEEMSTALTMSCSMKQEVSNTSCPYGQNSLWATFTSTFSSHGT